MKKIFLLLTIVFAFSCKDFSKGKQQTIDNSKDEFSYDSIKDADTETNDSIFLKKGKMIAQSTQKVLGQNLMLNIQKNGLVGAVEFCNEKAYPLTDSMAIVHHAKIKRVTDRPRNTNNKASEKELEYIEFFKSKINNNESYKPILTNDNGITNFYSPIVTNTMCLNCHGIPETNIDPKVTQLLNDKYPYDQAVGYTENEVRGIWSISFKDDQNK
ncbi:DUF3365 domain-containing protein [Maribacter sp. SA7]|uniref:Tll0287-like domain-containing protein n=1 Tax=Maribacter zhoushanensis TaxID=3030012 RepID=UPI0023EC0672|nr:DUF3365 domain-containing protein [Maribacter zhoushanensis]MDF4204377.1 DUF3365 domain-containing protein [Maribacter zhoushanensis]